MRYAVLAAVVASMSPLAAAAEQPAAAIDPVREEAIASLDWASVKQWAQERSREALRLEAAKGYDGRFSQVKASVEGAWRVYEDFEAREKALRGEGSAVLRLELLFVYGNLIPAVVKKAVPELDIEARVSRPEIEALLSRHQLTLASLGRP